MITKFMTMGHLLILVVLCFAFVFYCFMTLGRGILECGTICDFCYFACIKFCKCDKSWKMLLIHLSSLDLMEHFPSKESIFIIIFIFFHVDLNFLNLKVAPLKIILTCIFIRQLIFIILKIILFYERLSRQLKTNYVTYEIDL